MPPVDRRTALGGAVAGGVLGSGLLGGCTGGLSAKPKLPGRRTYDQLSADEQLVADLVAQLTRSTTLLAGISTKYPLLGKDLASIVSAEKTHLVTLRRSAQAAKLPTRKVRYAAVPGNREAALTLARTETTALRAALLAAAQKAESGQFARLLASMGCALSQRQGALT